MKIKKYCSDLSTVEMDTEIRHVCVSGPDGIGSPVEFMAKIVGVAIMEDSVMPNVDINITKWVLNCGDEPIPEDDAAIVKGNITLHGPVVVVLYDLMEARYEGKRYVVLITGRSGLSPIRSYVNGVRNIIDGETLQ